MRNPKKLKFPLDFRSDVKRHKKKFLSCPKLKTSSWRNFFEFNTMEGQYIFGQSNGKPTFLSIDTGKTFSLEDKGEWISGWKDGKQCWFNTGDLRETSFSSPVKVQNNDVLPNSYPDHR